MALVVEWPVLVTICRMGNRRRWVWPSVAWTVCAVLTLGYIASVYYVFFGCDDALIWRVSGPPILSSACAVLAAIWGFKRASTTTGRVSWTILGLASALMCGLNTVALYISLSLPCDFYSS